jgi:hypothetical protein
LNSLLFMFRWIFARSCAALDVTIFATFLKIFGLH